MKRPACVHKPSTCPSQERRAREEGHFRRTCLKAATPTKKLYLSRENRLRFILDWCKTHKRRCVERSSWKSKSDPDKIQESRAALFWRQMPKSDETFTDVETFLLVELEKLWCSLAQGQTNGTGSSASTDPSISLPFCLRGIATNMALCLTMAFMKRCLKKMCTSLAAVIDGEMCLQHWLHRFIMTCRDLSCLAEICLFVLSCLAGSRPWSCLMHLSGLAEIEQWIDHD